MTEAFRPTPNPKPIGVIPGLALLLVRGILLWIVIPLGFAAWIVTTPWRRPHGISLGQFLGWIDNNLINLLQRSVLRPLFSTTIQPWIPSTGMSRVRHRVNILDPY